MVFLDRNNLNQNLEKVIELEVEQRVQKLKGNIEQYTEFYDEFIETLNSHIDHNKELLEESKEFNLNVNSIQFEEALRTLIMVKNEFEHEYKQING